MPLHSKTSKLLYLGFFLMGCGDLKEISNQRNSGDLRKENSPVLSVESTFNAFSNQRLHELNVIAKMSSEEEIPAGMMGLLYLKSTTLNPDQKPLADNIQKLQPAMTLPVSLEGPEGQYGFTLEILKVAKIPEEDKDFDEDNATVLSRWQQNVVLDMTAPTVSASAILQSDDVGDLRLNAELMVKDEFSDDLDCKDANLQFASNAAEQNLKLKKSAAKNASIFSAENISLNAEGAALLLATCSDEAGNNSDIIETVKNESLAFGLATAVEAKQGNPKDQEVPANKIFSFVNQDVIKFTLNLMHKSSLKPLSKASADRLRQSLRIYITAEVPRSIEQLKKMPLIWSQNYAETINLRLPSDFEKTGSLVVTLTQVDQSSNQEVIINSTLHELYFDEAGPEFKWISGNQFIAAAKNAKIPMHFSLIEIGAPIENLPEVLYSTDNNNWLIIPDPNLTKNQDGTFSFELIYPFEEEMPFRVKLRASDLAGNSIESEISPNVIGPPGLNLTIAQDQRDSCKGDRDEPKSRLDFKVGSSFLCQLVDSNGNATGAYKLSLVLQNSGQAPFEFFSIADELPPGIGFWFEQGSNTRKGKITDLNRLPAAITDSKIVFQDLLQAEVEAPSLTLKMDIEESGAPSLTNTCQEPGSYAEATFNVVPGPFPCVIPTETSL